MSPIDDDKKCKHALIREFKNEFEFRNDIRHEYFEGDERDMISVFNDYVSEHLPNTRKDFIKRRAEYSENNRPSNNKYRIRYCGLGYT
jgi:hypothetical protein